MRKGKISKEDYIRKRKIQNLKKTKIKERRTRKYRKRRKRGERSRKRKGKIREVLEKTRIKQKKS